MEPEERQEVIDLLEHKEKTAAGRMTTDFLALPERATVEDAVDSMREFEGGVEAVSGERYRRTFDIEGRAGVLEVRPSGDEGRLLLSESRGAELDLCYRYVRCLPHPCMSRQN